MILYRWNIVDTVTVVDNIYEELYTIISIIDRFVDEFGICILSFLFVNTSNPNFEGLCVV